MNCASTATGRCSYADAENLVQETMIRAWRERESLNDPERLRPWLYRIVTRARPDFLARRLV
ncbi:sigma factor [Streptomyces uncialis]|uniref:sigma factor n=1 Tax=Streptomyces uncialis TaxID=1048205 RepID=UPI00386BB4B4|nr:hypothetical protein OG268_36330 [Streptomyces uncialis]